MQSPNPANPLLTTGIERRHWTRMFPEGTDTQVEVRLGHGARWPATLIDESYGGAALLLEMEAPVMLAVPLEVIYRSQPMRGEITNITRHGSHQRVGFRWLSDER